MLISLPAEMNSRALKRAWIAMWMNAISGRFSPSLVIIIPSCLSVDSAIIFFMSHSVIAENLAISIVETPINRIVLLNPLSWCRNG